jgi:hypothetical protein
MLGLFCPLEDYAGSPILTVDTLCFVVSSGFTLKFSPKFIRLKFVECGVSNVIQILEFHYLDYKCSVLP